MRKAIAIDFDGCLCSDKFPEIGEPNWDVIKRAHKAQEDGAGLILWTCRHGKQLQEAIDACESWGLRFDAVNESLPEWVNTYGSDPRKIGAMEYWDDRAVRMPKKKNVSYSELQALVEAYYRLPQDSPKKAVSKVCNDIGFDEASKLTGISKRTLYYYSSFTGGSVNFENFVKIMALTERKGE